MSDMPETARNMEKSKSEPVSLPACPLTVRGSAAWQPHRLVSCIWQALAGTVAKWFPFLAHQLSQWAQETQRGSWFPVTSWKVREFHRFVHELYCQKLANAAGQDSLRGHCPYSPWSSTGNSLAPSALKRLANSGFY